ANCKFISVVADIPGDIVSVFGFINLIGRILCPVFLEQHFHLIRGGGEAGPTTRTPEVSQSPLTEPRITTVVRQLGTHSL
ncbi:beta-aspartyl-peptidase, partial [Salmonella enterica subsp. enterica serovar Infantis]